MGKILKYCNSCDEGFAEKFTFCPDCGKTLEAFEMNPLQAEAATPPIHEIPPAAEPAPPAAPLIGMAAANEIENEPVEEAALEAAPVPETAPVAEEPVVEASAPEPAEELWADEPEAFEEEPEEVTVVRPTPVFAQSVPAYPDGNPDSFEAEHDKAHAEGNYYLTVLEEKNVKQRNSLLMGTFGLMIFAAVFLLAYSIFSRDLDVGAINDSSFLAVLVDDVPMPTENEPKQKQDKSAGGGGGGGRQQEETTQGDLANQTKNPQRAPEAIPRMTNPELLLPPASTQGNKTFEQTHDRYGDPNGRFTNWNNGTGSGGGQGSGTGTGQGSGRGTGAGSGIGSGYGGGIGDGNGNGTGSGTGGEGPPPKHVGVSQGLKILSKPRPGYTDAARQANIQGTVILRVTFLANGSIGGVSAVKGLPSGLTEKAIAAAHQIAFEPAKVDGVAQSVTKQIEYSFSIY